MLLPRLPLHHHHSSQLSSCPLSSSSRPSPLSTLHCIPARCSSRRSLFACCAKKGEADGGDGQPSWAHLWTGSKSAWDTDDASPSAAAPRPQPQPPPPPRKVSTSSSRLPRSPRLLDSDKPSTEAPSKGSLDAWSNHSSGSSPSCSSGSRRPSPTPLSRGRSSSSDSRHERSRAGGSPGQMPEFKTEHSPSRSSNSSTNSSSSSSSSSRSRRSSGRSSSGNSKIRSNSNDSSSNNKSSSSRSSSSNGSSRRDSLQPSCRQRFQGSSGSSTGYQGKGAPTGLDSCLQGALTAVQPWQCSKVLKDLGSCVRQDQRTNVQYSEQQLHRIEAAAGVLSAALLGSSSSRSTQAAALFQQLDSKQLSLSLWGIGVLADCAPSIKTRQLHQLVDGVAAHATESSILDQPAEKACMNWSMVLHGTAKLGVKCKDSQPVQQLFDVAAQQFPRMLRLKQDCAPQSLSMTLWAFSTAEYPGSLRGLVAEVASNQARPMMHANSQEWSDALWALGTMADRRVDLGERSSVDAIMGAGAASMEKLSRTNVEHYSKSLWGLAKAGCHPHDRITNKLATAVAERSSDAKPQELSNTLWALATLRCNPDDSTVGKLAAAVAERNDADPQALSNSLWALATLDCNPGPSIVRSLAAAVAERSSEANPQALSNTLWAVATLTGCNPGPSTVRKLAAAVAERSSEANSQALSNTLWALATLGCNPGPSTVCTLAAAVAERSSDAKPQEISNTLWALATLDSNPDASTVSKLAAAVTHRSSDATPQALSNTLWALATLNTNPGPSIVCKLAAAVTHRSSDATPQALSNTLWALSQLSWYDARQIRVMVTALAQHQNSPAATAQSFSNTLQALGSLRWYDACLYSQLVEGVLTTISSDAPDQAGQQLSNTIFNCALSCNFDSSVDELAEWGSQQSLQCWTEQTLSNALYAWAILSATAGGDTANMRKLAQHLFAEASKRGVAAFKANPEWRHDMGKLFSAHQEALHVCLPGGGVSDVELLRTACEHVEQNQQQVGKELSLTTSAVSAALQGVHPAMVQGYHALRVHHPSCPRGITIAVTHPQRDYMRRPSGRMYGKAALRVEQMKRGCDGVVMCDETEVQGKSAEKLLDLLVQRIEQAARG